MKAIHPYIILSLLVCTMGKADAMNEAPEPIITLGSINNQITSPDGAGRLECFLNGQEIAIVHAGKKSFLKAVLFTNADGRSSYATVGRLNLELRHPRQDGFKELRLKLGFDRTALSIVKDLADGKQRPQEFHPVEDGKKYLLTINVTNENGISAELIEDNN